MVESWADLARALAIYPATNSRVVRALGSFFAALRAKFDGTSKVVEVCFSAGAMWVDEEAFDLKAGTNLAWLKERLDRADLSGAAFSDTASDASMLAFTQRVLELYTRQNLDLDFKELWPAPHTGITLLERRFEGPFFEPGREQDGLARPGVISRASLKAKNLCNALSLDPRIRSAIDRLQARLLSASTNGARFGGFDIIAEIVDVLPAEGLHDFSNAVQTTEKILAAFEGELIKAPVPASSSTHEENATLRRLVFVISRSHFNTIETGPRVLRMASEGIEPAGSPRPIEEFHPHQRDAEIGEDLGALLTEMEGLGGWRSEPPGNEDLSDPAEELGVFLHYLVSQDDPAKFPTLSEGIGRLLRSAGDAGTTILRTYLEASRSSDHRDRNLHLGRVATWLRRNGHREYLEKCGLLSAEWISREFPDEFLAYLETLDLDDARHVKKLDAVCREIGPQRLLNATELLSGATEFVTGPLAQRLFSLSLPSIGPLLLQIYEKDEPRHESDFARYVRTTTATRLDRAIFEVLESSPSGLPPYWRALFDNDPEKLAEKRAQVVHSFLVATEGDPAKLEQHVRAINLLANFDTPRSREYLQHLVGERAFFVLKKYPRSARTAAAGVLRVLQESEIKKDV